MARGIETLRKLPTGFSGRPVAPAALTVAAALLTAACAGNLPQIGDATKPAAANQLSSPDAGTVAAAGATKTPSTGPVTTITPAPPGSQSAPGIQSGPGTQSAAAPQAIATGASAAAGSAAPLTPPTASHGRLSANEPARIVSIKGPTVVMYSSETGNDGERVPAASLDLPMRASVGQLNTSRLTVATANGPRWIAQSEVVLSPGGH